MEDSIARTVESLREYGPRYDHWAIAWSGGKDSSTVVTLVVHLIESGQIPAPKRLSVLYADTRLELTPLWLAAKRIGAELEQRGIELRRVMAPMDKRFLVYILGRGVPPPNNNTLRWCTRQIKVDPMSAELKALASDGKILTLTGVRMGESAVRDQRITMSCSRDGAECGQGWFQETLPGALTDTLAPILHWRVCHVWDWLRIFAPGQEYGAWPTAIIADAYGAEDERESQARTGCIGCPLASRDLALDGLLGRDEWSYLEPLKELRPLWRELREPRNRLRQPGGEARKDGTLVVNQHRMGPITLTARTQALSTIVDMQRRVNNMARRLNRPEIDIISELEIARILQLIEANTWPRGWTGNEPRADEPFTEGGQGSLFDCDLEVA